MEKAKGEDVTLWEDEQLDPATEKKGANKMLSCHKEDRRYGPSFERITVLDSERYKLGEEVDFLRGCYNSRIKKAGTYSDGTEETVKIIKYCVVEDSSNVPKPMSTLGISKLTSSGSRRLAASCCPRNLPSKR